jgi:tol-pal system protein YbgF
MNASRLIIVGLALSPALLFGQKREEIVAIQRDVAQLEEQVKQLQKTMDEQLKNINGMLQQLVDNASKTSSAMTGFQQNIDQKMSDQQTRLVAPVATLGTKVDSMSDDFRSVRENVSGLMNRMGKMDAQLTDINAAIRTLAAAAVPVAPPPAVTPTGGAAAANGDNPPPDLSADSLYQSAKRDFTSGKDELAFEEFTKYLKYFKQTENAPEAQFYIGELYMRANQYDDAVKAYDAVVERFPENPNNPKAIYMKGVALQKLNKKTDAAAEFRRVIKKYPDASITKNAHQRLRELGLEPTTSKKRG